MFRNQLRALPRNKTVLLMLVSTKTAYTTRMYIIMGEPLFKTTKVLIIKLLHLKKMLILII